MLIRIVRMHFAETGVAPFLAIFNEHRKAIGSFPGCTHLQLLKDINDPLCITTLSHWKDSSDLENYRKSELFEGVWARVKPLFSRRTEAFSMEELEVRR